MSRHDPAVEANLPERYEQLVADEEAARNYLLEFCWPDGEPECPRCRERRIYRLSGGRLRCAGCKYTFQPFSGRWINNGALSAVHWLRLTDLFVREYSPHRLTGGPKQMRQDTIPVFGLLRKDDLVFIDLMPGFQAETVFHFHLNFHLKLQRSGNLVYTDQYRDYAALIFCGNDSLPYAVIRRSDEPPFIDASQDAFWCLAKDRLRSFRGISCQRFALYLKELEFRFNNRSRPIFEQIIRFLCDVV
jgi:transposase